MIYAKTMEKQIFRITLPAGCLENKMVKATTFLKPVTDN